MTDGPLEYAFETTSLGEVLVAGSAVGVSALLLGDDRESLLHTLRQRLPHARLAPAGPELGRLAARAAAAVEAPGAGAEIPLVLQGTAFQQAVWQALGEIPPGRTASYAELARRIGRPGAVRAVGQACGANLVAVLVPCHRAVRSDGSLSGYRWGVARKRQLLAREAAVAALPLAG